MQSMEKTQPEESAVKIEIKTEQQQFNSSEKRLETFFSIEERKSSSEKEGIDNSEEERSKADEHKIGDLEKKDITTPLDQTPDSLSQKLTGPAKIYPKSPAHVKSSIKKLNLTPVTTQKSHQNFPDFPKEEMEEQESAIAARKYNFKKGEMEPRPPMRDISNLLAIDNQNKSTCVSDFALVLKHASAQDGSQNDKNGNKDKAEFNTNSASWKEEIISVVREYLDRDKSAQEDVIFQHDSLQNTVSSRIHAVENNLLQLKSLEGKTESILNEKISAQENHVDSFIKKFYDDLSALRDQCARNHNGCTLEERFNVEIERWNQNFASLTSQLNTEKAESMSRVRRLDNQLSQYQTEESRRFKEEISVLERRVGAQLKDKADYFSDNFKKLEQQFKQIEHYSDGAIKDVTFTIRKLEERIHDLGTKSFQMSGDLSEFRRRVQRIVEREEPKSLTTLLAELQCQVQPVQEITKKIELLQSEQPKMIKQQVIESIANHISSEAFTRLKDMVSHYATVIA